MTNQEVIVWLKETKKHYGEYHEKADEALDIAIKALEQPQGECANCDFRKFTEKFIDGVVEVMNENDISSIEQLSEILRGGAKMTNSAISLSFERQFIG